MSTELWAAGVSATAALVSGLGGVLVGDRLRARGEDRQWKRQQAERDRQEHLALYTEILEAAALTRLALDLHHIIVSGEAIHAFTGAPGPEQAIRLGHLLQRAQLLGVHQDLVVMTSGLLRTTARALRYLYGGQQLDAKEFDRLRNDMEILTAGLQKAMTLFLSGVQLDEWRESNAISGGREEKSRGRKATH